MDLPSDRVHGTAYKKLSILRMSRLCKKLTDECNWSISRIPKEKNPVCRHGEVEVEGEGILKTVNLAVCLLRREQPGAIGFS